MFQVSKTSVLLLITVFFISLDLLYAQPDSVKVTFEVRVPELTPDDATIYWAGSLNSWDPGHMANGFSAKDRALPMAKADGVWRVTIQVPAGEEIEWKYTRGSMLTVEENADFTYREVRSQTFISDEIQQDTVNTWHDIPHSSFEDQWPIISLKDTALTFFRNGIEIRGSGTIVYDKPTGSRFFDFTKENTRVESLPESVAHVAYFIPVSDVRQNTILVAAILPGENSNWQVYVDLNNDRSITEDEFVFETDDNTQVWTGYAEVNIRTPQGVKPDSVELELKHVTDLPAGYQSTAHPDAPNLMYLIPLVHKKGVLNDAEFFVSSVFGDLFTEYPQVAVDKNLDGKIDTGSGSDEISVFDHSEMYRNRIFYIPPKLSLNGKWWELADIDPFGEWVRLRPSAEVDDRPAITLNTEVPKWNASTIEGVSTGSEDLKGNYVLLDFWGSWCGPCIEALPEMKRVYEQFGSKNFEIIGFAYEDQSSLERALEKYELPWPQVTDQNGEYSYKFRVRGYPSYYLVNPEGVIVEMGNALRKNNLRNTLEKYLGE